MKQHQPIKTKMSKVFTITEGLENLGALRTGGQGSVYKGRRMGPYPHSNQADAYPDTYRK